MNEQELGQRGARFEAAQTSIQARVDGTPGGVGQAACSVDAHRPSAKLSMEGIAPLQDLLDGEIGSTLRPEGEWSGFGGRIEGCSKRVHDELTDETMRCESAKSMGDIERISW